MSDEQEEVIHPPINSTSLVDAPQMGVAVTDGADHLLRSVDSGFCRLFNGQVSDLVGRRLNEVIPGGEAAAVGLLLGRVYRNGAAETLTTGDSPCGYDMLDDRTPVPDQSDAEKTRDCRSYTSWPLLDSTGQTIGLVTQIRLMAAEDGSEGDACDLMRIANERLLLSALRDEERAEELLRADRAKDEFLAMLAHELRNPLAAIRSGVYLVSHRAEELAPELQLPCDLVQEQIHHLARLLDDLLDVSRITMGKIQLRMERFDVVRAARYAILTMRPLVDRSQHELSEALPSEPVWIEGDSVRLTQAIANLLHNAAKYTNPGGHIWVTIEKDSGDAGDPAQPSGRGEAVIRVRDSGIGIRGEAIASIFEPFVQTEGSVSHSQGGLGIGLTLVRRLVEMHGGRVLARSDGVGKGSEFVIRLPLHSAKACAASPEPPAAPKRSEFDGQHVLIVDDNVQVASLLRDVLELWGYTTEVCHSGKDAIGAALVDPPDVILLDIGLDGMDGYRVAETLRERAEMDQTLLVAITGFGQEADRARARTAGFDYHLTKPVDLDELRETIGDRRRTLVEKVEA